MTRFRIEYRHPETDEAMSIEEDFEDTEEISAKEWAEDYAYTLADKGWYRVTEIRSKGDRK